MLGKNWESTECGGAIASKPLQVVDDILEARQFVDRLPTVSAAPRLLRVLVADRNRDTADSLALLVELWGHDAEATYDGESALALADIYQPDVLLADIAIPKMDGYQLARRLRLQPRFSDTLLIAITGYADQAHRRLSNAAGFDLHLVKPVQPRIVQTLLVFERMRLNRHEEMLWRSRDATAFRPYPAAKPSGARQKCEHQRA